MLHFCRANREDNFALHVSTAEEMLPYVFAAGHPYARYGCLYVDWMKRIPSDLYHFQWYLDDPTHRLHMDGE